MKQRELLRELKLLRERLICVKQSFDLCLQLQELADTGEWKIDELDEKWDDLLWELMEKYPRTHSRDCFLSEWSDVDPIRRRANANE